jgi:hypothetical protein
VGQEVRVSGKLRAKGKGPKILDDGKYPGRLIQGITEKWEII